MVTQRQRGPPVAERTRSGGGRGTTKRGGTTRTSTTQARTATTRTARPARRGSATADATDAVTRRATDVTHPERTVVPEPPPAPDYPRFRVEPGTPTRLADIDPDESEHYQRKKDVADELKRHRDRISDLQARLYGEQRRSLLIVLQAMDTGGKDGTIKGVFAGVNPQGCQVWSFKAPSNEEAAHDFLWRYHQKAPPKGMIHIFNRSHYEDVLKFFLHISKDEQKRRLESRLQDPDKRWKFSSNDLKERAWWEDYQAAFEDAVNACSTTYAPWYVVPTNIGLCSRRGYELAA